jgi:hypothetical protein
MIRPYFERKLRTAATGADLVTGTLAASTSARF